MIRYYLVDHVPVRPVYIEHMSFSICAEYTGNPMYFSKQVVEDQRVFPVVYEQMFINKFHKP